MWNSPVQIQTDYLPPLYFKKTISSGIFRTHNEKKKTQIGRRSIVPSVTADISEQTLIPKIFLCGASKCLGPCTNIRKRSMFTDKCFPSKQVQYIVLLVYSIRLTGEPMFHTQTLHTHMHTVKHTQQWMTKALQTEKTSGLIICNTSAVFVAQTLTRFRFECCVNFFLGHQCVPLGYRTPWIGQHIWPVPQANSRGSVTHEALSNRVIASEFIIVKHRDDDLHFLEKQNEEKRVIKSFPLHQHFCYLRIDVKTCDLTCICSKGTSKLKLSLK